MAQSILEVARELIESPEAKAAYGDDPDGFMAARGLDTLTAEELDEAVGFVAEAMPAPVARQLVTPTDPVADQLPLARVAAATVVEAGVAEAEPGSVDLTALVDPSGQLDLPTDGIATASVVDNAAVAEEVGGVEEEPDADTSAATDVEGDSVDATTDHDEDIDDNGFGTGAPDQSSAPESDESDEDAETDATGVELATEEADIAPAQPAFEHDDDGSSALTEPHTVPGKDEEPPEDDFEDVII